jgi:release factor glutamine methyltransferase
MNTLKAALEEATALIGRVDAHVLFAHLLGVDRSYLIANPMRVLTETEDARLDSLVARRALGHPVAHLIAQREFYGRMFAISADVLIPRPETEVLVEAALERIPRHSPSAFRLLDLGTGSGAIAVALACERPHATVTATDSSPEALAIARGNAAANGCDVEFLRGSWYEPLASRRFDLIVSNPPYIARNDPHLASGDLRFEPALALTDGSRDGLDSIRAIVHGAAEHLEPGGWLLIEHGYDQKEAVQALLAEARFTERFSTDDLAGIPRVAGGRIVIQ